jgi:hypothetical protein
MWTVQGHSPRWGAFTYRYQTRGLAEAYYTACACSDECTWLELVDPDGEVARCA